MYPHNSLYHRYQRSATVRCNLAMHQLPTLCIHAKTDKRSGTGKGPTFHSREPLTRLARVCASVIAVQHVFTDGLGPLLMGIPSSIMAMYHIVNPGVIYLLTPAALPLFKLDGITEARQTPHSCHHRRIRPKIMWTFNCSSPQKLENQGDWLVSEAQQLLDSHWAKSWPSRRQHAQELIAQ